MNKSNPPINVHEHYHAHLYFDQETIDFATELSVKAGNLFTLQVGDIINKPIGPHPQWSCQIAFSSDEFGTFIPWLEDHRQGLSVLVHGVTGDDLKDHTEYAYWLGESVELNLELFRT